MHSRITYIANSEFGPGVEQQSPNVEMINEVRLMHHVEDESRWQVVFDINTPPVGENLGPYQPVLDRKVTESNHKAAGEEAPSPRKTRRTRTKQRS